VEILIKGEGSLKGLVQILGSGNSENHLVCSIGFKLFCSLFDHEYNKGNKKKCFNIINQNWEKNEMF
jgi:hypothetical protein